MNDKEYNEWERQIELKKKLNNELLIEFEKHLNSKSLKASTVKKHINNLEFFANHFLLRYDSIPVEEGGLEIGGFLGDYLIHKTTWASKNSIMENIASFNKFYSFLNEIGKISDTELAEIKEMIKEEKAEWLNAVSNYWNDIETDW